MYRKILFVSLNLFVFQFASLCLADTTSAIQAAQYRINSFIEAGNFAAADRAVRQLRDRFVDDSELPKRLCRIAYKYEQLEALEQAKSLNAQIAADFAGSSGARYAGLQLAKLKIYDLIDSGDYKSAAPAVSKMTADFTGDENLPRRFWEVANRYDKTEAFEYAKALSTRITADYPKDEYAKYASLLLEKLKICEFIDEGKYDAADIAVSVVRKDFAGHKQLAKRLWEIANRFDKLKAYGYSKTLCEKIVANYPKDEYAGYAGLQLAKLKVYELIDAENYEAADAAIAQMINSYAKQKQLSRRLYEIAHYYEKQRETENAAVLYNRIAGGWPDDEYGVRAFFKSRITNANFDEAKIAELQNEIDNLVINNRLSTRALAKTMLNIAEMCYEKAVNSEIEGNTTNSLLHISSELLEKYVAEKTTGPTLTTAYYVLGLNYDKFGEYAKAADAFKNAYQIDPKFKYADYCLFAQGYCYEILLHNKLISEAEAKPHIAIQYNKLLSSHPQSKYAQYASDWLQSSGCR